MMDTILSPPLADKCPTYDARATTNQARASFSQGGQVGAHFKGPEVKESPYITGCTVCLVCCVPDSRRSSH